MKTSSGKSIRDRTWPDRLIVGLPVVILAVLFISITHDYQLDERTVTMRYLLFAMAGIVAFLLPHISFPDPAGRLFQLGNLPARKLVSEYIARQQFVWGTGAVLVLVTALADNRLIGPEIYDQLRLLMYGGLFLAGIYLYAAYRYLKVGKDSQQWQEGERGQEVRRRFAELAKYPLDPGSVPSMISSILIATIGMMAVVTGAVAHGVAGPWGEVAVAVLLFLFGMNRYSISRKEADYYYYQTNAFFSEFFGEAQGSEAGREPLKTEQLWWIPLRWKAHGWALILQMDRKMPAGRLVAVGHLIIWVLAYQDAGPDLLMAAWGVFAVLHHGLLLLTANPAIAPRWWLRKLDSPLHWVLSRFWIQVRWLLPLMVSMLVMNWLFGLFTGFDLALIACLYLFTDALIAFTISLRYERYLAD